MTCFSSTPIQENFVFDRLQNVSNIGFRSNSKNVYAQLASPTFMMFLNSL